MTTDALSEHMKAKITPKKVARVRERIGIRGGRARRRTPPYFRNTIAHEDTIRHFVHGYGDDNPLFTDAEYAAKTRWGGIIAPHQYLNTVTSPDPRTPPLTPEQEQALSGGDPLKGIHVFVSGATTEYWRPVRPGRRFYSQGALVGVIEKRSQFANLAVHMISGNVIRDDTDELIAYTSGLTIHTERETAAKSGKYNYVERPHYTAEDLARIDEAYANEFRRGSAKLYWEDVTVGKDLPLMVKGPVTVTDIIFWHVGGNETAYNLSPLGLAYKNRQRIGAFYLPNEFGAWEAAQRCHWDDQLAQATGNPFAYDYGSMRTAWLAHYLYNWIGDDGWLWKYHVEHRRFNYVGDTTWIRGKVTNKYELDGPRFAVEVDLWGENQRGEVTTPGNATVLLPSHRQEDVILPDPPAGAKTMDEVFNALIAQHQA
jgi:acyl dehydratase